MNQPAVKNKLVILLAVIFLLGSIDSLAAQRGRVSVHRDRSVARIPHLPAGHNQIMVNQHPYFYFNGIFYQTGPGGFFVTRAPLGARISILPFGYATLQIGTVPYYYYYGTYYRYLPEEKVYLVVEPPFQTQTAEQRIEDKVNLVDGSVLVGRYLGGTQSLVQFEFDGEIREIPVNEIISISFAPPAAIEKAPKQEEE